MGGMKKGGRDREERGREMEWRMGAMMGRREEKEGNNKEDG